MRPIRVLVVDDSATMRRVIAANLERDPGIVVVGEAADPLEARQAIKALNPDVMTLDLEMPHMNGLDFLEKVMRLRPFPVVMISSLTAAGATAAVRGLELGAVECIGKPTPQRPNEFAELPQIVRAAAAAQTDRATVARSASKSAVSAYASDGRLVAIGASTGGVEALISVLEHFPANCPPTVVALHLPAPFTTSLAQRLDRLCQARVCLASDTASIEPGHIYIAPGSATHLEVTGSAAWRCRLTTTALVNGHRPSVDVLFQSVAQTCGKHAVGAILTGMGRDGAAGLLSMRQAGARTLGQSEVSCVVYGMPKVAHEIGATEKQVALNSIGCELLQLTNRLRGQR